MRYQELVDLFIRMKRQGIKPDAVVKSIRDAAGGDISSLRGTPLGFALERAQVSAPKFRTLFLV